MRKIICISGKQYCGKDTLAKILIDNLVNFKRIGIGDAIKIEFGKQNGLTCDEINSNKGIYRTGLIKLGDYGRSLDPDYWLKKILEMNENIVIPDIRLIHEAEVFKKAGAYLIRVEASYDVRSKRGVITNSDDPTECELDNYEGFDYKIHNEGNYEELVENSKKLIGILKRLD